jgi:hypothetical protein
MGQRCAENGPRFNGSNLLERELCESLLLLLGRAGFGVAEYCSESLRPVIDKDWAKALRHEIDLYLSQLDAAHEDMEKLSAYSRSVLRELEEIKEQM